MHDTPVPPTSPVGAVRSGYVLAGRYALNRLLARGGMADVWEAQDTLLERQVAVKLLHPHLAEDDDFVERFRIEAVAAARLHHRSIVAIFDTCSQDGVEAIVMELIHGHTLREEIDTHGPLDPPVVINLGADVADALLASHRAGLIHRDVKPANILLCDDQRVMVTDFGIAKIRDTADRTQTGTMLGSVKYVSPEQVEGKPVDPRTDVYSLGIVLYEALTGQAPFDAETPAATALARLHTTPPAPEKLKANVPKGLSAVVMRAMARDPGQRFPGAAELRAALLATRGAPLHVDHDATAVAPRPVPIPVAPAYQSAPASYYPGSGVAPRPPPPPPRSRRRWGPALIIMALIVAALGISGWLLTRTNTNKDPAGVATASGDAAPPKFIQLKSAEPFDPVGKDGEDDAHKANVIDGKLETVWHTEYYQDRKLNGKPGVGMIVGAAEKTELKQLVATNTGKGWAAQVYVSDESHDKLKDWGEPVDKASDIQDNVIFDLNTQGRYVLLWITDVGTAPPPPPYTGSTVEISEIALLGLP